MMTPESLSTLVSYLEHLNYIHKHEKGEGDKAGLPPKVPDHLRSESSVILPKVEEDQGNESLV